GVFPEIFTGNHPAGHDPREKAVPAILRKHIRAIITPKELRYVFALVVIPHPSEIIEPGPFPRTAVIILFSIATSKQVVDVCGNKIPPECAEVIVTNGFA